MHRHLLYEHSSYFKNLIGESEARHQGHVIVRLPDLSLESCAMLTRWLYGQPLCENHNNPEGDLEALVFLYGFVCDTEEESDTQKDELVDACVDAIRQCLSQKTKTLRNPIDVLELLLAREDVCLGKAVVLKELVYGECGTDGRTKIWLERFCGPGKEHDSRAEIAEMVCLEFAKKACE